MIESKILIESTDGLHTRLAVNMVQAANKYSCDMKLVYEDKDCGFEVNFRTDEFSNSTWQRSYVSSRRPKC